MGTSDAIKENPDDGFERAVVLEILRIGVRDNLAAAEDRAAAEGALFREAFARIDWEKRTVNTCGHDVGEVGVGVTRIGIMCIKFGWFLTHCGFKPPEAEKYFQADQ